MLMNVSIKNTNRIEDASNWDINMNTPTQTERKSVRFLSSIFLIHEQA